MSGLLEQSGERLRLYREYKKYSQKQFAEILDVKQESLSKYENGRQSIPDEVKIILFKDRVNINWLLTGQGEMFVKAKQDNNPSEKNQINENDNKHFSDYNNKDVSEWKGLSSKYMLEDSGVYADNQEKKNLDLIRVINGASLSTSAILIPDELKKYEGKLVAIKADSDDMEPTIKRYSVVLCDVLGFRGSGIYAVRIDGNYLLRRISVKPGAYFFSSDNKMYESFEVPIDSDKIKIGGQVRFVGNILY